MKKLPTVHEYHLKGCMALCAAGLIVSGILVLFVAYEIRADWSNELQPIGYIGNVKHGERLVWAYGCPSCHQVSAKAPQGQVGPPLIGIAGRSYIAGHFANHEIWMTRWLEHPQALKPGTAMPDLNVSRRDALDIAAYLATMKE